MKFEQPLKSAPEKKDDEQKFYAGAKKNLNGSLDLSQAVSVPDPDGKLAGQFENIKNKQEKEINECFEWERQFESWKKQLKTRHLELLKKSGKQHLSKHGQLELERLKKVSDSLITLKSIKESLESTEGRREFNSIKKMSELHRALDALI
jgi:hypothetical protein